MDEVLAARCSCPAKINLTLDVLGRRADGYHLIESEMVPIALADTIVVQVVPGPTSIELEVSGRDVPGGADNLVYRAAELFVGKYGCSGRIRIHLAKRVPSGAGLGGGSSDAAATLRVLDELFEIGAGEVALRALALELGADVPFFVTGRPATVSGIGEISVPLATIPEDPLVVAFGGPGLATAEVYAGFDASLTSPQAASTIRDFPRSSGSRLRNDLERAASLIDPGINRLREALLLLGASEAGMSGSGSAVFGFFRDRRAAGVCAERLTAEGHWAEVTSILEKCPPVERLDPEVDW